MLDRNALLFSPTRDGVPSSDDNFYASDLIAAQDNLEAEARDTLPFEFKQCTYDLGYIRQPLYACLTCLNNGAVCAACSIACHGEHELVELFNRRHFRCDCGTERLGAGSCCSISARDDAAVNEENKYDANFHGQFCFCGQPYDPHTETDSMYQCLCCEDWIHHACLFGTHSDDHAAPLGEDDFDMIICERCVKGNDEVRKIAERYGGREKYGVVMVTKDGEVKGAVEDQNLGDLGEEDDDQQNEEKKEEKETSEAEVAQEEIETSNGKRKVEETKEEEEGANEEPPLKKVKPEQTALPTESSTASNDTSVTSQPSQSSVISTHSTIATSTATDCQAPPDLPSEATVLGEIERNGGRLNLFLQDGWQDRWCRCRRCLPMFANFSYMLEEEEEYTPPEDSEVHKSTFELGMDHLLNKMPRVQALDSIRAFSGLSERIKEYLRPLADSGVSVGKEHIESFFAAERERRQGGGGI